MRPIVAMRLGGLAALLAVTGCDNAHAPSDLAPIRAAAKATGGDIVPLGDFALYVPSNPGKLRGVFVTLGGPNTRAFVTGEPTGAPLPPVEAALQALGASFRALAEENRIALIGAAYFGPTALPNTVASDQLILDAIAAGAAASGHPELADAPILIFASSGGAPEASGFTARNAERVAGVFLSVPPSVTALTTEQQRQVPTFVSLSEFDVFVDNAAITAAVAANRVGGALWSMALEKGAIHFSLTPAKKQMTLAWLEAALDRRINGASGGIRVVPEQSGWLGNPTTGEISTWGAYSGDRSTANWLPTEAAAEQWRAVAGF